MSGFQEFFLNFLKNVFCWTYSNGLKTYHFSEFFEFFGNMYEKVIVSSIRISEVFSRLVKKEKIKVTQMVRNNVIFWLFRFFFGQILGNIHEKWETWNIGISELFTVFCAEIFYSKVAQMVWNPLVLVLRPSKCHFLIAILAQILLKNRLIIVFWF